MVQNRQDMGSGPVKPLLLQLMIPAVVAQVVNLLYNIVDRIYIGHIEGIGAVAMIKNLYIYGVILAWGLIAICMLAYHLDKEYDQVLAELK